MTRVRADFPILSREVHGKPLVYLDNAATAQKPNVVIDAVADFYRQDNANIHRGVHFLSMQATARYDKARERIAQALGAPEPREVLFVRGATEATNLVAQCFLRPRLKPGDEILVTEMEHHGNIIPWQLIAAETGATVRAIPITDAGELDLNVVEAALTERTRMLSFTHVSNVLGTINPAKEIVALAKARGIPVFVDGAQAIPHGPVNVQDLDCDFYTFSGHKVYGPDGIGILYGRAELLNAMPPYQGGGDMIERVRFEGSTYREIPERFEAGTPNISSAIALAVAFDYLENLGWDKIHAQEQTLLEHALNSLREEVPEITLYGPEKNRASVVSFALKGVHPHDVGTFLDGDGIAIRVGHHCAQPLMDRLGVSATTRASFAFYNTTEEVDKLVAALCKVQKFFG
ncbi:MAG: cysteine desulfurase/selenocysteine lyase [Verrucomicrobiales bacterium]|jgi:cysteine desulfurase/selenocysteine lyase